MIELTLEQRQAVERQIEIPPRALDPGTQTTYVLIREEIYNRVKALFAEEENSQFVSEMYPHALEVFGKEGWDDPALDAYDELAEMAADPAIQRELRQIEAEFSGTELDGLPEAAAATLEV